MNSGVVLTRTSRPAKPSTGSMLISWGRSRYSYTPQMVSWVLEAAPLPEEAPPCEPHLILHVPPLPSPNGLAARRLERVVPGQG